VRDSRARSTSASKSLREGFTGSLDELIEVPREEFRGALDERVEVST
jgi:hypothetical protein